VLKAILLNKTILLLLLSCFSQSSFAQDIGVFQDKRGHFFVFEKGIISKLEFLDIARDEDNGSMEPLLKIDGDRVVYVNSQNYTIHYRNGEKKIMDYTNNFFRYLLTDQMIVSTENDILAVVEGYKKKTISLAKNTQFAFGENILVFIDYDGRLSVYDGSVIREVTIITERIDLKASDTSFAWTDELGQFMFWKNGESQEISIELIQFFEVGNDFVVYLDEYSAFRLFKDGESVDLENYEPESYKMGDDIFAYVSDQGDFKLYAHEELQELDLEPPKAYEIVENTMYYVDSRNFFKVYDSGRIHDLETYRPDKIAIDEGVVAYTDHRGYLWAYYEGDKVQVSEEIVEDFDVQGRVITYSNSSRNTQIYWEGNRY